MAMLKRLLLLWIFSGSLDGFSQETKTLEPQPADGRIYLHDIGGPCKCSQCMAKTKPDTLRAICLVTLFPNGIAHARMGYVVIAEGKEVQYLDCRKNALKLPQVGWGYRVVNPNEKVR